jgi:hypothetical protein
VIEPIEEMPAGTLGFRISGEVTADDYKRTLIPALEEALSGGEKVSMLAVLGPDFKEFDAGALWQDVKTDIRLGFGHLKQWERAAVVTDLGWVQKASRAFGWLAPGELRVFPLAELDQAKDWIGG